MPGIDVCNAMGRCEGDTAIKAVNDSLRQLRSEAAPAAGDEQIVCFTVARALNAIWELICAS